MNTYDHYQETKAIIEMLQGTSLNDYAALLQGALDEGSTGTEIFMALRWNIGNLLNEIDLDDATRTRAKKLWEALDMALQ